MYLLNNKQTRRFQYNHKLILREKCFSSRQHFIIFGKIISYEKNFHASWWFNLKEIIFWKVRLIHHIRVFLFLVPALEMPIVNKFLCMPLEKSGTYIGWFTIVCFSLALIFDVALLFAAFLEPSFVKHEEKTSNFWNILWKRFFFFLIYFNFSFHRFTSDYCILFFLFHLYIFHACKRNKRSTKEK